MFSSDYPAVVWLRPHDIPLICNYTLSNSLVNSPPAQIDFFLMGKKNHQTRVFSVNDASYKSKSLKPKIFLFVVVLSYVFFDGFKKGPSAVRIPILIDETTRSSCVFKACFILKSNILGCIIAVCGSF
jgi:hypothetical protein